MNKLRNYLTEIDSKGNAESLEMIRRSIHMGFGRFENKLRMSSDDTDEVEDFNTYIESTNNLLTNMINKVRGEKNAN